MSAVRRFGWLCLIASVSVSSFAASREKPDKPDPTNRFERIFRPARVSRGETNLKRLSLFDGAAWITHGDLKNEIRPSGFRVVRFRREFTVDDGDAPFEIEIVDQIGELGSVGTLTVTGHHEGEIGSIVNTNGIAESILTVWAEITNKPGSALPETGGMGTTIFTVLGIVMMVGAVAFFTSRKRSSVA